MTPKTLVVRAALEQLRSWTEREFPDYKGVPLTVESMIGIAASAELLRIAMRAVRQMVSAGKVKTKRDLLDWLRFAQSETDGIILGLARLEN